MEMTFQPPLPPQVCDHAHGWYYYNVDTTTGTVEFSTIRVHCECGYQGPA